MKKEMLTRSNGETFVAAGLCTQLNVPSTLYLLLADIERMHNYYNCICQSFIRTIAYNN